MNYMRKKINAQANATVPEITLNCRDYFVLTDSMFYLACFFLLFILYVGKCDKRRKKKHEKNENSQAFGSLLFYSPMCHSLVLRNDEN